MIMVKLSEDGTKVVIGIFGEDGNGMETKLDAAGATAMVAKLAMLLPYLVQQAISGSQTAQPGHKFDVKLSS